jgi:hypothetical protein
MSLYSTDLRVNGLGPTNMTPDINFTCYISTLSTTHITLDGNGLDTTGSGGAATLLLNGVGIATNSGLASTIGNWALYPALSTISYATGGGSGGSIIMSNGIFSNVSTTTGSVNALSISTLNGQTVAQLGQTVLYRPVSTINTNFSFNNNTTALQILSFPNPVSVGGIVSGSFNADFAGNLGGSNSANVVPSMVAWITDNNTPPYAPTNALGGAQFSYFYPLGPNGITGPINTNFSTNVNVNFAYSNAPANLSLIWQENTAGPSANLIFRVPQVNFSCVVTGATAQSV